MSEQKPSAAAVRIAEKIRERNREYGGSTRITPLAMAGYIEAEIQPLIRKARAFDLICQAERLSEREGLEFAENHPLLRGDA